MISHRFQPMARSNMAMFNLACCICHRLRNDRPRIYLKESDESEKRYSWIEYSFNFTICDVCAFESSAIYHAIRIWAFINKAYSQ